LTCFIVSFPVNYFHGNYQQSEFILPASSVDLQKAPSVYAFRIGDSRFSKYMARPQASEEFRV
jgi:hypothetical protein